MLPGTVAPTPPLTTRWTDGPPSPWQPSPARQARFERFVRDEVERPPVVPALWCVADAAVTLLHDERALGRDERLGWARIARGCGRHHWRPVAVILACLPIHVAARGVQATWMRGRKRTDSQDGSNEKAECHAPKRDNCSHRQQRSYHGEPVCSDQSPQSLARVTGSRSSGRRAGAPPGTRAPPPGSSGSRRPRADRPDRHRSRSAASPSAGRPSPYQGRAPVQRRRDAPGHLLDRWASHCEHWRSERH